MKKDNGGFLSRLIALSAASSFVFGAGAAAAADLSAGEIVSKAHLNYYYAGDDGRAEIVMRLINEKGREQLRELTMLKKDIKDGGAQKYFVFFHKPDDVRGMTFMVWKNVEADDDRWLYVPAIHLIKRVAASDKRSSFVGSDFTYEDVSGRPVADDKHELVKEEKLNKADCYVVKSTPKDRDTEYAYRIAWIDRDRFLPLKEEYYDARGELIRTFEAAELKTIQGILTVTRRVMKNVKTGHRTEVTFGKVEYDLGIPEDVFTERYMERPPRKWFEK
ncbi:MAG: outer membrane lipoprotein-sorting protein [bacterium]